MIVSIKDNKGERKRKNRTFPADYFFPYCCFLPNPNFSEISFLFIQRR